MSKSYNSGNVVVAACVLGFALTGLKLKANENEANDKTIIVSANRFEQKAVQIPTNITVISSEEIESSAASTLSQILRTVPGIQLSTVSGKTVVSLRGLSAEQAASNVLVQIDGRRLNNTDLASPDLESVAVENIERIEIIHGSASSLYGDQAVGGVINIITKNSFSQAGILSVGFGSYDAKEVHFNWTKPLNENWALALSAELSDTENYRAHNDQERKQITTKLGYENDGSSWQFELGRHREELETPGALLLTDLSNRRQSRPEFQNDFVNTKQSIARISGEQELSSYWDFSLDINYSKSDIESVNSFIGFATTNINLTDRKQLSIYPRFKTNFDFKVGVAELVFGLDYDRNDYQFSLLGRENKQKVNSLYGQSYLPIAKATQLQLATRYSKVEDNIIDSFVYANGQQLKNDAFAYDIGINQQIADSVNLHARYSKNFRFAKVDEQAYTSPGVLGLDPQEGYSLEVGLNYKSTNNQATVSVYQLNLKNEIFFDPSVPGPIGAFFAGANVNGSRSERFGATVAFDSQLSSDFKLGVNYHYVDSELLGKETISRVPGVSKNTANIWFDWKFADDWNWYLEANYRSDRFQEGDLANLQRPIKSHNLVNTAINWNLSNFKLALRVDNVFGEDYIEYAQFGGYYPAKGKHGSLKITYIFENG